MSAKVCLFDLDNTLVKRSASIYRYVERFVSDFSGRIPHVSLNGVEDIILPIDNGGYPEGELPGGSIKMAIAHALHLAYRDDVESLPHPGFDADPQIFNPYNDALKKDSRLEQDILRHVYEYFHRSAVAMDGAEDLLKSLKQDGWALGVVSNGSDESRQVTIDAVGFRDLFDVIISSGSAGVNKPNPKIFTAAVVALGANPEETWFVGDHPENDIQGAREAGLKPIWLSGFHSWPAGLEKPTTRISKLSELAGVLSGDAEAVSNILDRLNPKERQAFDLHEKARGEFFPRKSNMEFNPDEVLRKMRHRAVLFATEAHKGQRYGEHPYTFHLLETAKVAKKHDLSLEVVMSCWLHDTIEDTTVSYHDIKKGFGDQIAEIVYAVTDESGRNRKERKEKTYPKIQANEQALQVKLCDRIANVSHALETQSRHLKMYLKEHPEFRGALWSEQAEPVTLRLWDQLDQLCGQETA